MYTADFKEWSMGFKGNLQAVQTKLLYIEITIVQTIWYSTNVQLCNIYRM